MHPKLYITLALAMSIFLSKAPLALAANDTAGQPARATLASPQDTTTTYNVRDMDGHIVTVEVPAMGSPGVKVSDPAQRTVQATVQGVDGTTNRVTVQTQEGQMLILQLPPKSVVGMRVGDQFTLQVAQRSLP